jgi:uncharacterized protein YggT (Ycf19 family)
MMSTERREDIQVERGDGFEYRERVVEHVPSTRNVLVSRINRLLWLLAAIVVGLIAFRFVLMLIAANPGSGFVSFIYSLTDVLVAPFTGILGTPATDMGNVVDMASVFAMIVYVLLVWVITNLIRIVFAGAGGRRQVTRVKREE